MYLPNKNQKTALANNSLDTTLSKESSHLARLTENLPGSLYQYQVNTDGSSFFPFATQGIVQIYEYTAEEILADAEKVFSRIHPEDIESITASIQASALSMKVWQEEYRVLLPSKGLRWISGQANPQQLANGAILWHGYLQDITDAKRNEDQLIKALKIAEDATLAKSDLLSTVSHEIRTPLSGIIGLCELNLDESNLQTVKDALRKIQRSSKQLLQILNDALDYSKIEAGQLERYDSTFNLEETINDIVSLFNPNAAIKGLLLETQLNNLPQNIECDELRLRQILSNLISNAIKFTQEGKVYIQITSQKLNEDTFNIEFIIKDTGVGIAPDVQKQLFNAYSQADANTSHHFGGTGLGLVISERLVKLLGGEGIKLKSELGEGACFSFVLPIKEIAIQDECLNAMQGHLLVVDDIAINRELASHILTSLGFIVSTAENGQDAIDKANNQSFDLILMDLNMPVMDGFTATKIIKQQLPKLPIVAQTASIIDSIKSKYEAAGFDGYVTKPFSKKELITTLNRCLPKAKIEGINFTQGLSLFAGNEGAYLRLLKEFSTELSGRYFKLGQDIAAAISQKKPITENLLALHPETHALKGTAGNLGLNGLTEAVTQLDNLLRQGIKPDSQLLENFQNQLNLSIQAIQLFADETIITQQTAPPVESSKSLNTLLESIKANEFIDEINLAQAANKIPSDLINDWLVIADAIEQLDFDKAEQQLTSLIVQIK